MIINVVGYDPSLRHWGVAEGTYNIKTSELLVNKVFVIEPTINKNKQSRVNSLDIQAATQLFTECHMDIKAKIAFTEVPVGSQSSRAMASYGICIGVIGSLKASGVPIVEVTPTEVKMASVGNKNATKQQMIDWAVSKHPEANWPTHTKGGIKCITGSKAEHMADAIAAIYAGIAQDNFKQIVKFMENN